jgi:hypothetical protein
MTPRRWRTLTLVLVAAGVILAGLFGLRTLRILREFREHGPPPVFSKDQKPAQTDVELIRDWMTVPFIGKLYHVPPRLLYEALDISPQGNQDKSLRQLNEEYFPGEPRLVVNTIKLAVLENMPPLPATPPIAPTP